MQWIVHAILRYDVRNPVWICCFYDETKHLFSDFFIKKM